MQSYQSLITIQSNAVNKMSYIIDTIYKNTYIKSWKVCPNSLEIIFNYNTQNYIFNIYYEEYKPSYILTEIDNRSKFDNQLCNKINSINLEIDNYERVEDVLYDIIHKWM